MKVLAWYSVIVILFSILAVAYDFFSAPQGAEAGTNFWGAVMFIPIAYYLIKKVQGEK